MDEYAFELTTGQPAMIGTFMHEPLSQTSFRVHHVSYATAAFSHAARWLARTAKEFGIEETRIYRPSDAVVVDLVRRFPRIMRQRKGGGFWLWKSHIIRDTLRRADDGDAVLYTDAAVVFVSDPAPLLALSREFPIVLFEHVPPRLQRFWTKRDCFVALDADAPMHWDTPQLLGGFQLYRAGAESRSFVEAVCAAVADEDVLTSKPNVRGLPNLPGFIDHRHDQSVLTIVARNRKVPFFPDPSQFGPRISRPRQELVADGIERPDAPYGQIFNVHRKDNWDLLYWLTQHLSELRARYRR